MNLWGPAILLVNILRSASGQQVSWKELEGRCYAVIHTKAPFPSNNIPNVCYPYGAEPIKLKRQLEMEFVQTIIAGSDLEYWVGSKYNSTTREYYWDTNDHQKQPLPSMWLRNKPDFSGHCVRLTTDTLAGTGSGNTYGLADGQCSSQLKTVCEKQARQQVGWHGWGRRCYAVTSTKNRYSSNDTFNACHIYGAQPLKMETQLEMDFVQTIIAGSNQEFWVGITYDKARREYIWNDHNWVKKRVSSSMWLRNKPDSSGQCARLTTESLSGTGSGNTYGLADGDCSSQLKTVCEKDSGGLSDFPGYKQAMIGHNCNKHADRTWSFDRCVSNCYRIISCTGFQYNNQTGLCIIFEFARKCDLPLLGPHLKFFSMQPPCY